ncbi:MAG: inorganic diphosphatase [Candidatus Moranbacteria bacterium]|jgi:inorganic pyrophosphatase|nr:inorganic diphosphatase [Candidatus Moranbacteria bacterium]MDD5652014.1 inorganic diphosphatase [Candidatus Moranbacteria bacterium]MDX9855558.1 inorganic diphosphatase [Candidatus Moranbacteria bacterium]
MNLWHEVDPGKTPEEINVVIEIPRGSKNKYEIDKKTGMIKLDRAMKTSQDYPFDYGFVPQTYWEDGDALDVVVLSTYALASGILVEARPVGIMKMIDGGDSDDKIISVPKNDPRWDNIKDIKDVNPHTLKEIKHFFETYKVIEDKVVKVSGFGGRDRAQKAINKGLKLYNKEFKK